MNFEVIIKYNVDSNEVLEKEFNFEYYKHVNNNNEDKKEEILSDTVVFTKNQIVIKGSRISPIDIKNCWRTKRSNYRRCILSSLFYLYNYYKKSIEIESITIFDDLENKETIPFIQEFDLTLPASFSVDLSKIEYIFKTISFPELSEAVYRVLHNQAQFVRNKDFYFAYKSFNSMYTFYYSYHDQLMEIGDDNTADKVAITSLLKLPGIESSLEESISLAEKFFSSKFDEMRRLIYVWLMNENVGETQFQGVICDRDFHYQNKTVLKLIEQLTSSFYNITLPKNSVISKFTKRNNAQSDEYKINYLQLLAIYAVYRRNKLLHGDHVDPTFLFPDVNADILSEIAEIIFQTSVDLVNSINETDFEKSKIMVATAKR